MSEKDTISIHLVREALLQSCAPGAATVEVLSKVGIDPALLEQPAARVAATAYARLWRSVLAVQQVPPDQVRRYGIVAGQPAGERLIDIERIVEKPAPEQAPSRMAVAGRYVLNPGIFDAIRQQTPGAGGEIQLTDAIARLMTKEAVYAYQDSGKRYDCGSKEGFLEATVELALQHPRMGAPFRDYLKSLAL